MRTRLKVCCIASVREAKLAIALGADALGLVARMPSGPGCISDERIADIAGSVPPPVATFLLTSETDPSAVVDHVRRTGVNTVQLVDDAVDRTVWQALRDQTPAVRIVQVLHVLGEATIETAERAEPFVDALLLDSGDPHGPVRKLGGTGRVHDWAVSRRIVERSSVPVFLAGGLNPSNVATAIEQVRPYGIDLCSGVRTDGSLDEQKLVSLVRAISDADNG
ncbi:MAG: phosphoribosylanthranilate isomerase [Planctomycetota bacterium]